MPSIFFLLPLFFISFHFVYSSACVYFLFHCAWFPFFSTFLLIISFPLSHTYIVRVQMFVCIFSGIRHIFHFFRCFFYYSSSFHCDNNLCALVLGIAWSSSSSNSASYRYSSKQKFVVWARWYGSGVYFSLFKERKKKFRSLMSLKTTKKKFTIFAQSIFDVWFCHWARIEFDFLSLILPGK